LAHQTLRASTSGVLFNTPNTKNPPAPDVPNANLAFAMVPSLIASASVVQKIWQFDITKPLYLF